jgi:hypothetical protein
MAITATIPVTAPTVNSLVYDKWMVVKIVSSIGVEKAPLIVTLQRAAETPAGWVLMPNQSRDAQVTFNVDIYKEMLNTPELKTAVDAITTAVVAYGTKANLL